jgi:hypothetical protein
MGRKTGDKSRYNKMRLKRLARRLGMRALRKDLQAKADSGGAAAARPS